MKSTMFRATVVALMVVAVVGCKPKRRHSEVHTYEKDPGTPTSRTDEAGNERVTEEGEWRMAEPGRMVVEP